MYYKKTTGRQLSIFLILTMFFAVAGFTAYADETDTGENSTAAEAEEESPADTEESPADTEESSADTVESSADTVESSADETSKAPTKPKEKPAVAPANTAVLPDPTEDFYVLDNASVLTEKTRSDVLAKAKELDEKYGTQIVVVTIKTTGTTSLEDYCYQLFNKWKIGGEKGNGLLFILDIDDDTYTAMAGAGIKETFSTDVLNTMVKTKLEDSFSAKNYDAGVATLFAEAATQMEAYGEANELAGTGPKGEADKGGSSILSVIVTIIIVIIILIVIFFVVVYLRGQALKKKRLARRAANRNTGTYNKPLSRESYYSTSSKYDFDEFSSNRQKNNTRKNTRRK